MKQLLILSLCLLFLSISFEQSLVKIGDNAPNYFFTKMVNATDTSLNIKDLKGKPVVLAFWGTWCSPCIPEMIHLANLQKQFGNNVCIIGVSDDNKQKLQYFLKKHPSKIWFASDPSNNLWNIFGLQTAGHCVIINKKNIVVGITETEKVDSSLINKLLYNDTVEVTEDKGTQKLEDNQQPVQLDSATLYSFVLQPELKGITPMIKKPPIGIFAHRRITIINLNAESIFEEAYDISLPKEIIYPTKEDSLKSNESIYCIDFIVSDSEKINFKNDFQIELNKHLPFTTVMQKKLLPCYVLQQIKGKEVSMKQSTGTQNLFSYDGLGFEGRGIVIHTFIAYLENELNEPVYDATGLTQNYDLEFSKNNVEPLQSIKESLAKLGLEIVKDQKEINVLVVTGK